MQDPLQHDEAIDSQERPRVTVGVFVKNSEGKIFLIRSPKWHGLYVVPGGHVEYGETVEEAAIREMYEETGLTVKNPRVFSHINMIRPLDFFKPEKHFVGLEVMAELDRDDQKVKLDKHEADDYAWLSLAEIIGREDVESSTKDTIAKHLMKVVRCEQCAATEAERDQYKEGWQRANADYQNLQKEVRERRSELVAMSEAQIIEEFLPVYTNFKTAFAHAPKDETVESKQWKNWSVGIGYIMKQFADILKAHDIEEIATVGTVFDATRHDAVGEEESDAVEHSIIREVETGYTMKGKVMKVAKVIVAKHDT